MYTVIYNFSFKLVQSYCCLHVFGPSTIHKIALKLFLILRYFRDLGANLLVAQTRSWQLKEAHTSQTRGTCSSPVSTASQYRRSKQVSAREQRLPASWTLYWLQAPASKNVPFSGSCGGFSPDRVPAVSLKPDASKSCAS